jgi:hypothetical protein
MHLFVLFVSKADVDNPELPTISRRVIRVLYQLLPEPHEPQPGGSTPRFRASRLSEGLLVYCPILEGVCITMDADLSSPTGKTWHIVTQPTDLSGQQPYRFRALGPVQDLELLKALCEELKSYHASLPKKPGSRKPTPNPSPSQAQPA